MCINTSSHYVANSSVYPNDDCLGKMRPPPEILGMHATSQEDTREYSSQICDSHEKNTKLCKNPSLDINN